MQRPQRKYHEHSYEEVEESFTDIGPDKQDRQYFTLEQLKPLNY